MNNTSLTQTQMQTPGEENFVSIWIDTIDVNCKTSNADIFTQTLAFEHRKNVMAVLIHLGHKLTGFDKILLKQAFNITQQDLDLCFEKSLFEDCPSHLAFL